MSLDSTTSISLAKGILCENGVYLDINGASGVTVLYG
jgi:hypothetical protein